MERATYERERPLEAVERQAEPEAGPPALALSPERSAYLRDARERASSQQLPPVGLPAGPLHPPQKAPQPHAPAPRAPAPRALTKLRGAAEQQLEAAVGIASAAPGGSVPTPAAAPPAAVPAKAEKQAEGGGEKIAELGGLATDIPLHEPHAAGERGAATLQVVQGFGGRMQGRLDGLLSQSAAAIEALRGASQRKQEALGGHNTELGGSVKELFAQTRARVRGEAQRARATIQEAREAAAGQVQGAVSSQRGARQAAGDAAADVVKETAEGGANQVRGSGDVALRRAWEPESDQELGEARKAQPAAVGPAGPAGPVGPTGPAGPAGGAGEDLGQKVASAYGAFRSELEGSVAPLGAQAAAHLTEAAATLAVQRPLSAALEGRAMEQKQADAAATLARVADEALQRLQTDEERACGCLQEREAAVLRSIENMEPRSAERLQRLATDAEAELVRGVKRACGELRPRLGNLADRALRLQDPEAAGAMLAEAEARVSERLGGLLQGAEEAARAVGGQAEQRKGHEGQGMEEATRKVRAQLVSYGDAWAQNVAAFAQRVRGRLQGRGDEGVAAVERLAEQGERRDRVLESGAEAIGEAADHSDDQIRHQVAAADHEAVGQLRAQGVAGAPGELKAPSAQAVAETDVDQPLTEQLDPAMAGLAMAVLPLPPLPEPSLAPPPDGTLLPPLPEMPAQPAGAGEGGAPMLEAMRTALPELLAALERLAALIPPPRRRDPGPDGPEAPSRPPAA